MSGISEHNYEAYLLDALEGRLTAEQHIELDTFMALHPELAIDLEDLAEMSFDPQQAVFPDKSVLKKTGADLVSGDQFIAYIEQQLSPEDKLRVEASCAANSSLAKELELYQQTVSEADTSIVFDDKDSLKRRSKVILFNFRAVSFAAAASVALLLMLYVLWPGKTAEVLTTTYAGNGIRKAIPHGTNNSSGISPEIAQPNSIQGSSNNPSVNIQNTGEETWIAQQKKQEKSPNQKAPQQVIAPDTTSGMAKTHETPKEQAPLISPKEPVLIASAKQKTTVDVITENDGEETVETRKKAGFWAMAGKTLKGLNKAGVKTVNGEEDMNQDKASYALTLGRMNITHKAH